MASTYAHGISLNHRAALGLRIALSLQMPAKEGHVLHVGSKQNVERIAHNWVAPIVLSRKVLPSIRAINQLGAPSCRASQMR